MVKNNPISIREKRLGVIYNMGEEFELLINN